MTPRTRPLAGGSGLDDSARQQIRQARTQTALVTILVAVFMFGIGFYSHREQLSARDKRIADLERETSEGRSGTEELLGGVSKIQSGFDKVKSEFGKLDEKTKSLRESSASLSDDYTIWDEVVPQVQQSSQEVAAQADLLRSALDELDGGVKSLNETRSQLANRVQARPSAGTPTPGGQQQRQEVTVYITNTGAKYHRAGCQYLSRSMIPINKSDAISRGYGPCSRCNP